MRHWLGIVGPEQFATERLYARDCIAIAEGSGPDAAAVEVGDRVALVTASSTADGAVLFGRGLVAGRDEAADLLVVRYELRLFDEPVPVPDDLVLNATPGIHALDAGEFTRLTDRALEPAAERAVWFVSVALPIEAESRAAAVREFWTYLDKLGPRELPAYVWPLGDELAMQAFVLGAVTNLDPEEDEDG